MKAQRVIPILLLCCVAIGCAERSVETVEQQCDSPLAEIQSRHEFVRSKTRSKFSQAAFLSPDPKSEVDVPLWMAPLIVQELDVDLSGSSLPPTLFGTLPAPRSKSNVLDTDRQTVYLMISERRLGDSFLKQWTYLWFYPPPSPGTQIRSCGVRMTVGSSGHAIAWEILPDDTQLREVYVSQALEKAAFEQYGDPLPGRKFSVEPSLDKHPDIVVPRVVSDGPQPMGPFLYLDASQLAVATLICRCEPSQVDEFPFSSHYHLQCTEDAAELPVGQNTLRNLASAPESGNLDQYLRLPSQL